MKILTYAPFQSFMVFILFSHQEAVTREIHFYIIVKISSVANLDFGSLALKSSSALYPKPSITNEVNPFSLSPNS